MRFERIGCYDVTALIGEGGMGQVYQAGGDATTARHLVWVDREGNEEPVAAEPRAYRGLRLSPDGGRAAIVTNDDDGNADMLIYDLARDIPTRLTFDATIEDNPVWSPDGQRLAFAANHDGDRNVFGQAADGTGESERLTTGATTTQIPSSWSPDGKMLFVVQQDGGAFDVAGSLTGRRAGGRTVAPDRVS